MKIKYLAEEVGFVIPSSRQRLDLKDNPLYFIHVGEFSKVSKFSLEPALTPHFWPVWLVRRARHPPPDGHEVGHCPAAAVAAFFCSAISRSLTRPLMRNSLADIGSHRLLTVSSETDLVPILSSSCLVSM